MSDKKRVIGTTGGAVGLGAFSCEVSGRRGMRVAVWVAAAVTVLLVAASYVPRFLT
jgi:hypothetical protein